MVTLLNVISEELLTVKIKVDSSGCTDVPLLPCSVQRIKAACLTKQAIQSVDIHSYRLQQSSYTLKCTR